MDDLEVALLRYRRASMTGPGETEEGPLSDQERQWLEASNWAAEYARDFCSLEEVSAHLDTFRYRSSQPFKNREAAELSPNWRSVALSEILAITARRDSTVTRFRAEILADGVIAFDELAEWVSAKVAEEGPPTGFVTVPDNADRVPRSPTEAIELGFDWLWQQNMLKYPDPKARFVHAVPVRLGGVLDRLRHLANSLEQSCGWSEPYAVAFILTDVDPPPLRGSASFSHHGSLRPTTVRITVNPDLVSPSDVAGLYREAMRGDQKPSGGGEPGAGRPLEEKGARLAVFAAKHIGSGPWAQLMTQWNIEHNDWEYKDRRRFARDCRRAYKSVTGERLEAQDA